MTTNDIIQLLIEQTNNDKQAMLDVLTDGRALLELNITDQSAVESAYDLIMTTNNTRQCIIHNPSTGEKLEVTIALGEWDEVEGMEDESIFFYMDHEPLQVGTPLTDGFIVTNIEE